MNALSSGPKAGRPQVRQPTFNWSVTNKYNKLPQQILPATAEECEPLRRLTLENTECTWN